MSRETSADAEGRGGGGGGGRGAGGSEEIGPGQIYMPFVVMEDLLDKLKLLNYEEEFVGQLRKSGKMFDQPQETDDPNSTISKILEFVRKLGVTIDFAPSKLKQGFGEQAIFVLDRLSDEALRSSNFTWNSPIPPGREDQEEDQDIDEDMEVNLDRVEEEMAAEYSEEEEDDILHIDNMGSYAIDRVGGLQEARDKPEQILQSNTDAEAWNLEVERVAPQLKVTVRVDARDWRHHLEQMHEYRKGIQDSLVTTKTNLARLQEDIGKTLEKISSREKYLNSQLEAPLGEYKQLSQHLAQTREQYKSVSGGVTERSRLLSQITDDLESVKSEMEERGTSMTDGSPLVNIRKSLARVKAEIVAMDVRIGVVEHNLLQARMKDKTNLQRDLHMAVQQNNIFKI